MYGNHNSAHIIITDRCVIVFRDVAIEGVSPLAVLMARTLAASGVEYRSVQVSADCARRQLGSGYYGTREIIDSAGVGLRAAASPRELVPA